MNNFLLFYIIFSHSFLEQSRGYICQQKLSTVRKQLIPTKIEARRREVISEVYDK